MLKTVATIQKGFKLNNRGRYTRKSKHKETVNHEVVEHAGCASNKIEKYQPDESKKSRWDSRSLA